MCSVNINGAVIYWHLVISNRVRLFWGTAVDLAAASAAWFPVCVLLGQTHRKLVWVSKFEDWADSQGSVSLELWGRAEIQEEAWNSLTKYGNTHTHTHTHTHTREHTYLFSALEFVTLAWVFFCTKLHTTKAFSQVADKLTILSQFGDFNLYLILFLVLWSVV